MKYYIPILASNIDNVLSGESISPSSYYKDRGFGYNQFAAYSDKNQEFLIVYDSIESCPYLDGVSLIYIEIEDNVQKINPVYLSKGVYLIDSTIYLFPWNTKIFFENYEDYEKAVSFCKGSLCNKMWEYYQIEVTNKRGKNPIIKEKLNKGNNDIAECNKKEDASYNRLKGLTFGYFLGQWITIPSGLALLCKYNKQINDICSVISAIPFDVQSEYVKKINILKNQYNDNNPKRIELKRKWEEDVLSNFSTDKDRAFFTSITKQYGVLKSMMDNFAVENGIWTGPSVIEANKSHDWIGFSKNLEEYTANIVRDYRNSNLQKYSLKVNDGKIQNHSMLPIYNNLINDLVEGDITLRIDNIVNDRLKAATDVTIIIKQYLENNGKDWENSPECNFYNKLRQNISLSASFDVVTEAPDDMAAALAIFILRCEDFEDMIQLAIASGFGRYDLLIGLWGASKGYMDIPKTIFSSLKLDSPKIQDSYVSSFKLLYPNNSSTVNMTKQPHTIIRKAYVLDASTKELDDRTLSNENLLDILSNKNIKLSKEQQQQIIQIYNVHNGITDNAFFKDVGKIKNVGKIKIGKLKKLLGADSSKDNKVIESPQPELLAQSDWAKIKPFCGKDKRNIDRIYTDFLWFINNKKNTYDKMVDEYIEYLRARKYPKKNTLMWLAPFYSKMDIDGVKQALMNK